MAADMERHYDDGTKPTVLPHMRCCGGPCQQGRKPCPTPDACELDEDEEDRLALATVIVAVATVIIVLTAVFA